MTVIKFGWIQFICIYFLLWWASEHFLRCVTLLLLLCSCYSVAVTLMPFHSCRRGASLNRALRFLFVHKVVPVRHVAPVKLHSQ